MLGEIKLVLKSNFESLPSFEPSLTQFTQYEQEDLALKERGRNQIFFLSQFRYAKLNETISNTKLYAFDTAFTHVSQWNLSVYYNLFKWSKTFEYICSLLHEWTYSDLGISIP